MEIYWMCYVSALRACGAAQVIPNPNAEEPNDYSWFPASVNIENSDLVSSAKMRNVPPKPGMYQLGSSTYYITCDKTEALAFIRGARASRRCIATSLEYDHDNPLAMQAREDEQPPMHVMRALGQLPPVDDDDEDA